MDQKLSLPDQSEGGEKRSECLWMGLFLLPGGNGPGPVATPTGYWLNHASCGICLQPMSLYGGLVSSLPSIEYSGSVWSHTRFQRYSAWNIWIFLMPSSPSVYLGALTMRFRTNLPCASACAYFITTPNPPTLSTSWCVNWPNRLKYCRHSSSRARPFASFSRVYASPPSGLR